MVGLSLNMIRFMLGITFSSAVVDHKQSNNMQLHKYHELHAELTITN
jgi:hypothetical protein